MPKADRSQRILGTHAVLGMDVVSFSQLDNAAQAQVVKQLIGWIRAAIHGEEITENDYRWSPAGDGGFLTFQSPDACSKAVLVALTIARILREPQRNKSGVQMKFAVHSGQVLEADELGRVSNIWGEGINTTARILYICGPAQVLVSEQYYDTYIKDKYPSARLTCSKAPYFRTVKHGFQVQVRNVHDSYAGLSDVAAEALRWSAVGGLWRRTISEYESLIADAMNSGSPVAALAAAKFLLGLDPQARAASDLMNIVSHFGSRPALPYERQQHEVFSHMPPRALEHLLQLCTARTFRAGETICREGDIAESCFFTVSGTIEVNLGARPMTVVGQGAMLGEFGLWISDSPRTATLSARDDCLLLEVPYRSFYEMTAKNPNVLDAIAAMVKHRILSNIAHSGQLFPGLSDEERQRLIDAPVICEKREAGEVLDLRAYSYALFSGRLRTYPPDLGPQTQFDLSARGLAEGQLIVGIVTLDEPSSIDGDVAHVLSESVLVRFPKPLLLDLQAQREAVQNAWYALWALAAARSSGADVSCVRSPRRPRAAACRQLAAATARTHLARSAAADRRSRTASGTPAPGSAAVAGCADRDAAAGRSA